MISKEKQKFIRSLGDKKTRIEEGLFLVEGEKSILELINSDFEIKNLYVTEKFKEKHSDNLKNIDYEISDSETIEKISVIRSNNAGIAIVVSPKNESLKLENDEFIIVLETINDPGNLGTIIRICDWYGIKKIIASIETVELTNPKVVSSSMGSISRTKIFYTDLEEYFKNNKSPIYGAFLDGENIHNIDFEKQRGGFIIIGNESHGISKDIEKLVTKKITIPRFGFAESLNAGVATGIIIDNIFRKNKI
ncbi:MAG: RNA methyltransferase [Candidatus Gracilibacteria bacterium]|nr:RNA methyltransferase [Candidatus Gracilibacteria bacterium]